MAAVKDDNRRLAQTMAELRAERRIQERRLRDLQHQLDLARAQLVTGALEGRAETVPYKSGVIGDDDRLDGNHGTGGH